ncbi:MAG: uroporphyrinogen-III C-methyltransferase [Pseudomonadota bacterium]
MSDKENKPGTASGEGAASPTDLEIELELEEVKEPEPEAASETEPQPEPDVAPESEPVLQGMTDSTPKAAAMTETDPGPFAEPASPRRGSGPVAWLALLLALLLGGGIAGGAYWAYPQLQALTQRNTELESDLERLQQQASARQDQAQRISQLEQNLERKFSAAESSLAAETQRSEQLLQQKLGRFEGMLNQQRAELARYGANDRKEWLLAEAEYLLRLANQRLVMAGDVMSAQALLSSADDILEELDDVSLYDARAAVAADLAALRAVPRVDVQGIYLRLAALSEQADRLVIFQMPELEVLPELPEEDSWQARLAQGYDAALAKLSDYIIIRRRDVPMQALMDPQWEGLVRQNLRMLLEQAQVALLSGNQGLYEQSLERAEMWVGEFFESDESTALAMAREIRELQANRVDVELPNVSRSLAEVDKAILLRTATGGEG